VLSHPGSANLAGDAIGVLRGGEHEKQYQMRPVDLRDVRLARTCVDNEVHGFSRRLHGGVGYWVAQIQMVDDHVHHATLIAVVGVDGLSGRQPLGRSSG
jgi:hypothetical protein